ncbi:hypothetical protein IAI10_14255 [Clostridium sp. 19966]|uniref:phage tail fiber protein n=1 Tax=Clostridium sp. 19966 TaxID=2768166 RepID=UPI0028DE20F2|nr:hypothetical protein [Clostridium sp. 19966]MDT8717827.1 hypothetical protein [Clostridium sp. 19966]
MSMSNYLEDKLLNLVLRNTAFTSPTATYLALYTSDPGEADAGTEVTGGAYARQAIVFGAPSNNTVSNSSTIAFPVATAAWGTVAYVGIRDAVTGGNLLFSAAVGTSQAVGVNNQVIFNAGQITVNLD